MPYDQHGYYPLRIGHVIGSVKYRKSGYGYQKLGGRGDTAGGYAPQTGHVKIWYLDRVVDTALTVTNALRRIKKLEGKLQ